MAGAMVRKKNNAQRRRPRKGITRTRSRLGIRVSQPHLTGIGYLRLFRSVAATLPVSAGLKAMFEIFFNYIAQEVQQKKEYTGAFAMIGITPGALVKESPLLAPNELQFSFPSYGVSMDYIQIRLSSTGESQNRAGRWSAVLVPYREVHDSAKFKNILKDMTFGEISAMPYSKTASCRSDIVLYYKNRDKTNYCARPRELAEEIAMLFIIWEDMSRATDSWAKTFTPEDFSCNMEISAGMRPHTIFSAARRVNHAPGVFKLRSITTGSEVRVHRFDGTIEHQPFLGNDDDECGGPFMVC